MTNTPPPSFPLRPMDRLVEIMATLRNPNGGCPWDVEQTFATIAPHTIEEAYEVAAVSYTHLTLPTIYSV